MTSGKLKKNWRSEKGKMTMCEMINLRGHNFVCDTEDCIFWNEEKGCVKQTSITIQEQCCCDYERRRSISINLDTILVKYFGSGFPLPESPDCESYGKLIELLYDIGTLTEIDMKEIVETLDSISIENALYDCNGEMIYDERQIKEELALREWEDDDV